MGLSAQCGVASWPPQTTHGAAARPPRRTASQPVCAERSAWQCVNAICTAGPLCGAVADAALLLHLSLLLVSG